MFNVRRIAIIGAGPSGIVAAKYLRAQGVFDSITIYEQQSEVGGIWYYSHEPSPTRPIPQDDPFFPPDPPVEDGSGSGSRPPLFPSPLYDKLNANIQASLMQLQGQDFPEDSLVFPTRQAIQDYLLEYAQDVRHLIQFGVAVTRINLEDGQSPGNPKWILETTSITSGERATADYDAIVVASGHYAVPFVPDIRGISSFDKAFPGAVIHSKHYRSPDAYRGKKVLVIGNGPSGLDIAAQVSRVSQGKPLLSVRHPTSPEKLASIGAEEIAEVAEFVVAERGVRLKDGRLETGIDAVIVCTGFFYSFPFLRDTQGFKDTLIRSGKSVHGLYQHLFHIRNPTVAFLALNMKAVPWPLSEAQSAAVAAVWSNQTSLPPVPDMEKWSDELFRTKGDSMHVFKPLEDAEYINDLHDWVVKDAYSGKRPPYWNDEMFWERKIFNEARMRFELEGSKAKSLEELGFHYDPEAWKVERPRLA